jgi:hypothetical protein
LKREELEPQGSKSRRQRRSWTRTVEEQDLKEGKTRIEVKRLAEIHLWMPFAPLGRE